jgi:hypothetical protein
MLSTMPEALSTTSSGNWPSITSLALSRSGGPKGSVPIEDTGKGFTKGRKSFQEIPSSYCTIFDAAQPYNGGDFLGLLRDLSNDDKHRLLTPVLIRPEVFEPIGGLFRWNQLVDWDHTHAEKHMKIGAEILRAKLVPSPYPETDVEVAGYVTPQVLLPTWGSNGY